MTDRRLHWNEAWTKRDPKGVSWYQPEPEPSLGLVAALTKPSDSIIDVGGGTSGLAGALLASGYSDVTVLDVSGAALRTLARELGERVSLVRTIEADVLEYGFEPQGFALWHDRAVFVLRHEHHTPSGSVQPFTFVVARHAPEAES